jgi:hypothetical protein
MDMLSEYAMMDAGIRVLEERKSALADAIKETVESTGHPIEAHGLRARMKPGRKSIDHEMAAREAGVSPEIIALHTVQPAPRTSWAKVTAQALVDTSSYVTQAPPKFVIERV